MSAVGLRQVALEDPGWHAHRLIVEEAGLAVVPVPVDGDGIDVAALAASGADAVVVTPAHQFPTGAILSARRRAELIEWAETGDRLIVEDDYDAELCHDRVGALQGLAPDRVLYVGSASKRLAPGVRLGWMVAPSWLSWALITSQVIEDGGSEVGGQLALADFIATGELERHLRRMRLRYARRGDNLVAELAQELPGWSPRPSAGGLHVAVDLPKGADEAALLAAAARHGFGLEGMSLHSYTGDCPPGLVLGYGSIADAAVGHVVQSLAERVVPQVRRSRDAAGP
jgi:GntR family transcriptional regulator/MocR family aminotransferase